MSRRRRLKEFGHSLITKPAIGPNFLVVGGVKCGTFSLYRYLAQHPSVLTAQRKEVGYFNNDARYPNPRWYESQFRIPRYRSARQYKAVGEFTPSYCFSPCIERIAEYDPEMKLIMMIRDPVARAVSQYNMYVRNGLESKNIREALTSDAGDAPHLHYAYLARGRYHEQIGKILEYFPTENLLVQKLEELAKSPETVMRNITDFLSISPLPGIKYSAYNTGAYELPDRELLTWLSGYFAPFNRQLESDYGICTTDWT